jgi:hypothetical protein
MTVSGLLGDGDHLPAAVVDPHDHPRRTGSHILRDQRSRAG